jgi:hypothetical protein
MAKKVAPSFDPDAFLAESSAPVFDPDAFLDEKPEPSFGKKMEARIEGFGQKAASGWLPQLQGAVSQLIPDPGAELDEQLKEEGFNVQGPDLGYVAQRDRFIKRGEQLREEAPGAFMQGEISGLIAGSAPMAGALTKIPGLAKPAAGILGRVAQGAAGGALTGVVQNPGDVEGQAGIRPSDHLEAAKEGALFGGAFQGAAEAGKGLLGFGKKLKGAAELRGAGAVGASKKDLKNFIKSDRIGDAGKKARDIGRYALDTDLAMPGDDIKDIAERVGARREEVGKKLGSLYQEIAGPAGTVDAQSLSSEFLESVGKKYSGEIDSGDVVALAEKAATQLNKLGPNASMDQLLKFRKSVDDMIPYGKGLPAIEKTNKKVLTDLRRLVQERIDNQIEAVGQGAGRQYLNELKTLNKDYSRLSDIDEIARDRLAGELGNNMFSLTDKIFAASAFPGIGAGTGVATGLLTGETDTGDLLERATIGAGLGLASKGARTYGRPLVTKGLDAAGGLLDIPQQLIDRLTPAQLEAIAQEAQKAGLLNPAAIGSIGARARNKGGFINE